MRNSIRIGKSPSICPFLKNNGDEVPKGPSPSVFQEWTDRRTFSYLRYTSTERFCISKGNMYFSMFTYVHENILFCLYLYLSASHNWEVMESFIKASTTLTVGVI